MDEVVPKYPPQTEKEKLAYFNYWQSKTPEERVAETCRLSVEKYGTPQGSFCDGPYRRIRRRPDGTEEALSEWCGANPLHPSLEHALARFWELVKSDNGPQQQ